MGDFVACTVHGQDPALEDLVCVFVPCHLEAYFRGRSARLSQHGPVSPAGELPQLGSKRGETSDHAAHHGSVLKLRLAAA